MLEENFDSSISFEWGDGLTRGFPKLRLGTSNVQTMSLDGGDRIRSWFTICMDTDIKVRSWDHCFMVHCMDTDAGIGHRHQGITSCFSEAQLYDIELECKRGQDRLAFERPSDIQFQSRISSTKIICFASHVESTCNGAALPLPGNVKHLRPFASRDGTEFAITRTPAHFTIQAQYQIGNNKVDGREQFGLRTSFPALEVCEASWPSKHDNRDGVNAHIAVEEAQKRSAFLAAVALDLMVNLTVVWMVPG